MFVHAVLTIAILERWSKSPSFLPTGWFLPNITPCTHVVLLALKKQLSPASRAHFVIPGCHGGYIYDLSLSSPL